MRHWRTDESSYLGLCFEAEYFTMKLLTYNFLTSKCIRGVKVGYPLKLHVIPSETTKYNIVFMRISFTFLDYWKESRKSRFQCRVHNKDFASSGLANNQMCCWDSWTRLSIRDQLGNSSKWYRASSENPSFTSRDWRFGRAPVLPGNWKSFPNFAGNSQYAP